MQIKGWKSSNHPWIVADTHADTEVEIWTLLILFFFKTKLLKFPYCPLLDGWRIGEAKKKVSWLTAVSNESGRWMFGKLIPRLRHCCPDSSADDSTSAWWECVHRGFFFFFLFYNTTLYHSSAGNMWWDGAGLTHTGWLLLSLALSASAASANAFFSSNSSLFRTGPLRPSSTRFRANSLLYETEEERIWLRRGDRACRKGRVERNRRAAFDWLTNATFWSVVCR